jgi:hypothetical protein
MKWVEPTTGRGWHQAISIKTTIIRRTEMSPFVKSCRLFKLILAGLCLGLFAPFSAFSHCDALDGPVVADAKLALERGETTPVLKWVQKGDEPEVRGAFQKTLKVRAKGREAQDLADRYFFETVVRLHRASEGAPYTGLKPAGSEVDPAVTSADRALASGSVDHLVHSLTQKVERGVREHFHAAVDKKKRAAESVEAGRDYVEAYVEFVHYVKQLDAAAAGKAGHHAEEHHH